jgi:hypothetical protein
VEARDFSLFHNIQTSSGVYSSSYLIGIGDFFPGRGSDRGMKLTTHLHLVSRPRVMKL